MFNMFAPNKFLIIAACSLLAAGPTQAGLLGGGVSAGADVSVGGVGASADVGLSSSGASVGAEVGTPVAGASVGITKTHGTTATTTAASSKAAKKEAARLNLLLALVGSTVVDRNGQDLGVVSQINETDAGRYRVSMALEDGMPRDAARITVSRLNVRGDELWLPISRARLVSSLN